MNTFWNAPNARRYQSLIRENVNHVGKSAGFEAIEDFFFTYAMGYTTLSHDNIDVLMSINDDVLVIIEWAKSKNDDGTINKEIRQEYRLSDYKLIQELAHHFESKHTHQ